MQFKDFVSEARRNPDQNPKVAATEYLRQLFKKEYPEDATADSVARESHDDLYFVSMTEIDKLGINPKSRYSTPLGIYTYPLSYVIRAFENDSELIGRSSLRSLPFAGAKPFANVVKTDYNKNIICLNKANFDSVTFNYYVRKIGNFLARWRISEAERRFTLKLTDEQREAFWKNSVDTVEEWANKSEYNARIPTWGGRFWYVTMMAADLMAAGSGKEGREGKVKPSSLLWNKLFREIGIDGATDYGEGIIHGAEDTQGVFFTPDAIQLVARLNNKEYRPGNQNGPLSSKIKSKISQQLTQGIILEDEELIRKGVKLFEGFFRSKLSDKFPSGTSVERRYGYIYLIIEFVLNSVYNTTGHTQNPKRSIAMIKRALDLAGIETLDQNYIKESITNLFMGRFPILYYATPETLKEIFVDNVTMVSYALESIGASEEYENAVLSIPKVRDALVGAVEYKRGKGNFEKVMADYRQWELEKL